jgi:hypothetical protein
VKTKTVTVEGCEYTIRRWTVAERIEFLKMAEEARNLSAKEVYEKQIEIISRNTGLSREEIMGMDGVALDLLLKEIVEFNTPPLDLGAASQRRSTEAQQR